MPSRMALVIPVSPGSGPVGMAWRQLGELLTRSLVGASARARTHLFGGFPGEPT